MSSEHSKVPFSKTTRARSSGEAWTAVWLLAALLALTWPACESSESRADGSQNGQQEGQTTNGADQPRRGSGFGDSGPMAVTVVVAEVGPLSQVVAFNGEIVAITIVDVAPLEAGRLLELLVDEGDRVEAGDLLAELDADLQERAREEARARVDTAEARLEQAQAELEAQNNEVDRRRALVERNAFPESELAQLEDHLDVLESAVALADAQYEEARAYLSSTSVGLDRRTITAPIAGLVIERHVSPGSVVSTQVPLVTIVDESSLRVVTQLSEQRLSSVPLGTQAVVQLDALVDREFSATVTRVGHTVDRSSRTVEIELQVERGDTELFPGMFARGVFIVDHVDAAVCVPSEAVHTTEDGRTTVWTVDGGIASKVVVTAQLQTERLVAVVGIEPGDEVITSPIQGLSPGSAVYVINGASAEPQADPEVESQPNGEETNGNAGH